MDQRRECRARTRSALIIYSLRQLRLSLWFTVASVRLDVYPAPLNAEVLFVCPLSFALWASILKHIALLSLPLFKGIDFWYSYSNT